MLTDSTRYAPILYCLQQRAKLKSHQGASVVCGDQEISAWSWVFGDPVVGCFAPSLCVLAEAGLLDLPEAVFQRSQDLYKRLAARWLARTVRLAPLLAQLADAGIDAIPLKGAALVGTVYPRAGMRPMDDIDLLVRPADFLPAAQVFLAAGFRPGGELGEQDPLAFTQLAPDFWPLGLDFRGPHGLLVDLHQGLAAYPWFKRAFPIDFEALWARIESASESLTWTRQLSPYDMLAHLCLHPAFHGLQDLRSFYDLDAFIRSLPADWDWERFLVIAKEWGVRNAAYHAFAFARYFFETPLPASVMAALDPGPMVRWGVRRLVSPEAVLADRFSLGARFNPLVMLALVDGSARRWSTLWGAAFPGRAWLRDNPDDHTLAAHWWVILRRLIRKDDV
jgi:hypothetical protein